MSEYLSKEEIKQWRSSLEKITLEEFAARLGKKVEEKKETNDLIDIVLHGQPVVSNEPEWNAKAERLSTIADRAYEKEKELYVSPFSAKNLKLDDIPSKETETKTKDTVTKKVEKIAPIKSTKTKVSSAKKADKKLVKAAKDIVDNTKTGDTLRDDVSRWL